METVKIVLTKEKSDLLSKIVDDFGLENIEELSNILINKCIRCYLRSGNIIESNIVLNKEERLA